MEMFKDQKNTNRIYTPTILKSGNRAHGRKMSS